MPELYTPANAKGVYTAKDTSVIQGQVTVVNPDPTAIGETVCVYDSTWNRLKDDDDDYVWFDMSDQIGFRFPGILIKPDEVEEEVLIVLWKPPSCDAIRFDFRKQTGGETSWMEDAMAYDLPDIRAGALEDLRRQESNTAGVRNKGNTDGTDDAGASETESKGTSLVS
jgi:hypothetical protein